MNHDPEARIAKCLSEFGGPPDLAPQLVAMAKEMELIDFLPQWIKFHIGTEWSAQQFRVWGEKYKAALMNLRKDLIL